MITATLIERMGTDLSCVNAARVSFGKASEWENADDVWIAPFLPIPSTGLDYNEEVRHEMVSPFVKPVLKDSDAKLIKYLAAHKHYSPFGHCFASFHIKAPLFVCRQLVKHEYLRMNEISRRYVDSEPEFYVPEVWRGRSEDKKQGSSGEITTSCVLDQSGEWTHPSYVAQDVQELAVLTYGRMIAAGVAPEQARMVLPQSMYTEWFWSGSMDAFANMCVLRLKEDTQYETRLVAQQIDKVMRGLYPVSWRALVHG